MSEDAVYDTYWQRKKLLAGEVPEFPVRRWWPEATGLCEIEQIYFEAVRQAATLLDVGAGDLRVMRKLQRAGFTGRYDTQDTGTEHCYTFRVLEQITFSYEAILCLDVIEHLPLRDGLDMLLALIRLLAPGGTLIVQTPNARCIRSPLAWDMTHQHCYNAADLWAFLSAHELQTSAYRIVFGTPEPSLWSTVRFSLQAFITSRILGSDYADNVAVIAKKPVAPRYG